MNSERKNYPMKEFRAIFPISSILVIRSGYAKKGHFPILAVFQNVWDLHKFGLQIWIQNAKITLWKNFGQFFHFTDFHAKKDHFSILAVIQNIWDLHKDLNSGKNYHMKEFQAIFPISSILVIRSGMRKNYPMKEFRTQFIFQFFRFHRFWSSGPGMQKKITSQY